MLMESTRQARTSGTVESVRPPGGAGRTPSAAGRGQGPRGRERAVQPAPQASLRLRATALAVGSRTDLRPGPGRGAQSPQTPQTGLSPLRRAIAESATAGGSVRTLAEHRRVGADLREPRRCHPLQPGGLGRCQGRPPQQWCRPSAKRSRPSADRCWPTAGAGATTFGRTRVRGADTGGDRCPSGHEPTSRFRARGLLHCRDRSIRCGSRCSGHLLHRIEHSDRLENFDAQGTFLAEIASPRRQNPGISSQLP